MILSIPCTLVWCVILGIGLSIRRLLRPTQSSQVVVPQIETVWHPTRPIDFRACRRS